MCDDKYMYMLVFSQVHLQIRSPFTQWLVCMEQNLFLQIFPLSRTRHFTAYNCVWRCREGIEYTYKHSCIKLIYC